MLLYFLQWLKKHHPEIHLSVLSLFDGGLSEEFEKVSDEYFELSMIKNPRQNLLTRLKKRCYKKLRFNYSSQDLRKDFIDRLSGEDFDLIYANTVVAIPVAHKIRQFNTKAKLVLHVHELESEIKRTIGNFDQYSGDIDFIIAASGMVKDNLIVNHHLESEKISVIYEFSRKLVPEKANEQMKDKTVFHVGGSGKYGHRKGTDLFIQTARYINDNYPGKKIEFTWVGSVQNQEKIQLEMELNKLNLKNRITFVGEVQEPELYFKTFDLFLMTSREDPFPLVCIEAGMLGIPIICFDKATGISEVIRDKGGFIVPYLNIEAMAEKIVFYYNNPDIYKQHSIYNKEQFARFTADEKGADIFKTLKLILMDS